MLILLIAGAPAYATSFRQGRDFRGNALRWSTFRGDSLVTAPRVSAGRQSIDSNRQHWADRKETIP
jgi:hypothetical protein